MGLTLADDLLLLLIPRAAGTLPTRRGVHAALAAAVLVELAENGDAEIADGWVTVRAGRPLTSGTIEEVLTGTGRYRTVLDRLTEQGALVRTRRWWTLGVVSTTVWRLADRERRTALWDEVSAVAAGTAEPTTRTGALVALLDALRVLSAPTMAWPASELAEAVTKAVLTEVERPSSGGTEIGSTD